MNNKFFKIALGFFLILIHIPLNVEAKDNSPLQSLEINPPKYDISVLDNNSIKKHFEIKFSNIQEPFITFNYLEQNIETKKIETSQVFKDISKINYLFNNSTLDIDIEIITTNLLEKSYTFILETIIGNKINEANITNNLGVQLPINITINKDQNYINPKPDFVLKPKSKIFFTSSLELETQIINNSSKFINFGGEVISIENKEIFYVETIASQNPLRPKQIISKTININDLPTKGRLPFYGKVKVLIRGTVNNERHIMTQEITIWVLPYQLLIPIALIVTTVSALSISIVRRRFTKNLNPKKL